MEQRADSGGAEGEDETFRVAIATDADPGVVMPKLSALCAVLERELAQPSSGHLMVSYEALVLGAAGDGFELMWLPPAIASELLPSGAATALAVPVRAGRSSYATALFTRPDSSIRSLDDLRGKTAVWVDKRSAAGYLLPRALLQQRGVPDDALGAQRFAGSHEAVVAEVLAGRADFGATYVHLEGDAIHSAAWGRREVRVLASHGPIPADILACGRRVADDARRKLCERVLDGDNPLSIACRDLMQCDGFAAPDPTHFDSLPP